ncbi:MAG: hypothetical protein ACO1QB_17755 [Verrucomicrobiales bacterium]
MTKKLILLSLAAGPFTCLFAQENLDIEALKRELRELRQRTEQLEQKIMLLDSPALPSQVGTNSTILHPAPSTDAPPGGRSSDGAELAKSWSPTDPITLIKGRDSYLNIGFNAIANLGWSTAEEPSEYLNLGDHDPLQRGFSMRNAEVVLEGAVDPYFTGLASVVFKLSEDNETELEAEEIYLKTSSLPYGLQLKGGQFFANFGRHNPQHPHQWGFVDQPLILNRAFGPEGLRSQGAQLSWLLPTLFYSELSLDVMNGNGSQGFNFRNAGEDDGTGVERFRGRATSRKSLRHGDDFLFVPRLANSFDLTDNQTLLVGTSAAFGPNLTADNARTEVYGVDLYWKWKPSNASRGFPFVALQTEALFSRFEAGEDPLAFTPLPSETLEDYGFYSQILWAFKERWVAGLRGDWVDGNKGAYDFDDVFRNQRSRISPNLTFYPTEFSKLRLQYNYDRGDMFGDEHSVWFQVEFQLGAHSPHKF